MFHLNQFKNKIVIADASAAYRQALNKILGKDNIIYEAASENELLELLRAHKPKVVIYDFFFGCDRFESSMAKIREVSPSTNILILGFEDGDCFADFSISNGAQGYFNKSLSDIDLMIEVVNKIAIGERVVLLPQAV